MRKSCEQTERAIEAMSQSMNAVGQGLKEGLQILAQSFVQAQQIQQQQTHPAYLYQHQNMFVSPPRTPFMPQPPNDNTVLPSFMSKLPNDNTGFLII